MNSTENMFCLGHILVSQIHMLKPNIAHDEEFYL